MRALKLMLWSGLIATAPLILHSNNYSAQAADKDRLAVMKYRQLVMETKGKHNQAIKILVKSRLSHDAIVYHAEALSAMASDMLALFPPNSIGGKSRALKNIWDKNGKITQDFKNQAKLMKEESEKMVTAAKSGNYKKIKKQLSRLAAKGCRGCHTRYRGEK